MRALLCKLDMAILHKLLQQQSNESSYLTFILSNLQVFNLDTKSLNRCIIAHEVSNEQIL